MKKLSIYILNILAAGILAACTLTFDEIYPTEEEQGFDEPVTVQTEYGDVTYQYQEGVRPITKNVLEYVQLVEHDTILYFAQNTPPQWLPNVGDCVAAGCSRKLPYGLNHRVISREDVGGFYKVVCTAVSQDDIYKELDITIDLDYDPTNLPTLDSITLDSDLRPLNPGDSVPVINDFSLLDAADADSIVATRAKKDEDKGKDTTLRIPISVDVGKMKFKGEIRHEMHQTVHLVEKKSEDYREQWTIDKSVTSLDITAGIGGSVGPELRSTSGPLDPVKMKDYVDKIKDIKKDPTLNKFEKKVEIAKIRALLPTPVPITFVFTFDAGFTLDGAVLGGFSIKYHHAQYKDGYIHRKNQKNKQKVHEYVKHGYTSIEGLGFMGSVTVKGNVRVGVGCEIPGIGLGADVGVGLTAGVEAVYESNFTGNSEIYTNNVYLRAFVDLVADFEFYVSPLGFNLFTSRTEIYKKQIINEKTHFGPVIDAKKSSRTYTSTYDEQAQKYIPEYKNIICFSKLYTFDNFFSRTSTYPRVRVYVDELDGKFIDVVTSGNPKTVSREQIAEAGKQYTFTFKQGDLPSEPKSLICVPCLYDASVKKTTEFRDKTFIFGNAVPKVEHKKFTTLDVLTLKDYITESFGDEIDWKKEAKKLYGVSSNLDKLYHYGFRTVWKFSNMSFVQEWGFRVTVLTADNEEVLDKEIAVVRDGRVGGATKVFDMEFLTNRMGTAYGKCLCVRIYPYTVTKSGDKKFYYNKGEHCTWVGMPYPQNNLNASIPSGDYDVITIK